MLLFFLKNENRAISIGFLSIHMLKVHGDTALRIHFELFEKGIKWSVS